MIQALSACCVLLAIAMSILLVLLQRLRREHREQRLLDDEQRHARAQREQLLETLLDDNPAALVFYADAGRIVYANRSARHLFFEDQAAEGKNFLRLVAAGPAAFRSALLDSDDALASFDVEGQRETYHFARRTFPYAGELHTLLVVRQLTREVARHEIELLKRVVRLISHEVNNALGPVSSLIHSAREILKQGERVDRLGRVFATIEERSQHLSAFVASYAALSKLPKPQPRASDWVDVIARLAPLYPDVHMSCEPAAQGYFDAVQLEQALINLLKNGREAGGPVVLNIMTSADGSSTLIVQDRGPGFSQELLAAGVLPFVTSKAGGSGVGLTLVREIVDAHGGLLTLANRGDGGAQVTIRLPGRATPVEWTTSARLTLTNS